MAGRAWRLWWTSCRRRRIFRKIGPFSALQCRQWEGSREACASAGERLSVCDVGSESSAPGRLARGHTRSAKENRRQCPHRVNTPRIRQFRCSGHPGPAALFPLSTATSDQERPTICVHVADFRRKIARPRCSTPLHSDVAMSPSLARCRGKPWCRRSATSGTIGIATDSTRKLLNRSRGDR
jgi:hypothetical protein